MAHPHKQYQPPYSVYLADPGTAEPDFAYTGSGSDIVLSEPAAAWVKINEQPLGDEYLEFAITRNEADQEIPVNDVFAFRSYRESIEIMVNITLPDFDGAIVAKLLGQSVTTAAAGADAYGTIKFSLDPGQDIEHFALLIRASSKWDVNGANKLPRQWWFPLVKEMNGLSTTLGRKHAEYPASFKVYKHATLGVGNWLEANALTT